MRSLTAGANAALLADVIRPITMLKLSLDSGTILLHSGIGDIDFNGDTYLGVGNYGSITEVGELFDNAPSGITATLSGVDSNFVYVMVEEQYQGRSAEVYVGLLDENYALITDPALAFRGRVDYADIQIGDTADITLSIESRLVDWSRPRVRRYTNEDQQLEYPGDLGLAFVAQMVEKELIWGSS